MKYPANDTGVLSTSKMVGDLEHGGITIEVDGEVAKSFGDVVIFPSRSVLEVITSSRGTSVSIKNSLSLYCILFFLFYFTL